MKKNYKSSCCDARAIKEFDPIKGTDYVRFFYICEKCGKQCDIKE